MNSITVVFSREWIQLNRISGLQSPYRLATSLQVCCTVTYCPTHMHACTHSHMHTHARTHTYAVTHSTEIHRKAVFALSSSASCSQLGAISSCSHQRSSSTLVKVLWQNREEETSKDFVVFFSPTSLFLKPRVKLQRCWNDNTESSKGLMLRARVCVWGGVDAVCVFSESVCGCMWEICIPPHTPKLLNATFFI